MDDTAHSRRHTYTEDSDTLDWKVPHGKSYHMLRVLGAEPMREILEHYSDNGARFELRGDFTWYSAGREEVLDYLSRITSVYENTQVPKVWTVKIFHDGKRAGTIRIAQDGSFVIGLRNGTVPVLRPERV